MVEDRGTPPAISIITVCKNAERTIAGTITSVVSQKRAGDEYLVVDGGSSDNTLTIIGSMSGVDRLITEPDDGIAEAFNKGIAASQGEIIALVNSGDRLIDGALEEVRCFFMSDRCVDVIHGDVMLVHDDRIVKRITPSRFWWEPWRLVLFNHPATFVRRSVYASYGLFDSGFRVAMDVEIFFRWKKHGVAMRYMPKPLVFMEAGGISTTRDIQGFREFRDAAVRYGHPAVLAWVQYAGKVLLSRFLRLASFLDHHG